MIDSTVANGITFTCADGGTVMVPPLLPLHPFKLSRNATLQSSKIERPSNAARLISIGPAKPRSLTRA